MTTPPSGPHPGRSRREVLKAVTASGLGATAGPSMGMPMADKNPFVLVHPAWHGGWFWKKVVPLLNEAGHQAFTPTLTGLGERSHLARREIGLATHIHDVIQVLEYEELSGVVLVGHSSSGVVITGVAERVAERIAQIVYLDAFVPEDGQGVLDLLSPDRRQVLEALVKAEGEGWLLPRFAPPPWETIVRDFWGVRDETDARWLLRHLGPTPFSHFKDPVMRKDPRAARLPRSFIRCRQFPNPRMDQHGEMAKQSAAWRYRELDAGHHVAVTAPRAVVSALV